MNQAFEDFKQKLEHLSWVDKTESVGSQTIPGAAHARSDWDLLVLVKRGTHNKTVSSFMDRIFFVPSLSYGTLSTSNFVSYRPEIDLTRLNAIITRRPKYYHKFCRANELAIKYKLTNKVERIQLFNLVLS